MNKTLVVNWNKVIKPKDEIYILGDLFLKGTGKEVNEVLRKLKGKKYLIKGNHEKYLDDPAFDKNLFVWVKDYYTFKSNKQKFVLFHYPILEWEGYYTGSILLYGHVHNNNSEYFNKILGSKAINVGADMTDYQPISLNEILEIVKSNCQNETLEE